MLHGCGQTGRDFALSTRMNLLAARQRFFVLYPEQDRFANPQGCWNWHDRRSGKADAEAATLMAAVDQACVLYPVDRDRIAVAGLSAGASMAALLATRYPARFKAVAMHSGVAPGAAKSPATALGAMRGRHAPPMLTTAVGKAMGAAAVFTTLPPLLVLHGDADIVVSANNAGSTATVWAMATAAKPGKQRKLKRGNRHAMRVTDYKRKGRTLVSLCVGGGLGPRMERWGSPAAVQRCCGAQCHAAGLGIRFEAVRCTLCDMSQYRQSLRPGACSPECHETLFEAGGTGDLARSACVIARPPAPVGSIAGTRSPRPRNAQGSACRQPQSLQQRRPALAAS